MPSYRVTGSQPVLGHGPGETFKTDKEPTEAAFLKSIGAIEEVKPVEGSWRKRVASER